MRRPQAPTPLSSLPLGFFREPRERRASNGPPSIEEVPAWLFACGDITEAEVAVIAATIDGALMARLSSTGFLMGSATSSYKCRLTRDHSVALRSTHGRSAVAPSCAGLVVCDDECTSRTACPHACSLHAESVGDIMLALAQKDAPVAIDAPAVLQHEVVGNEGINGALLITLCRRLRQSAGCSSSSSLCPNHRG